MIKSNYFILTGAMGGGKSTILSRLAASGVHYNPTVFYFAGWQEIYTNDEERKISFAGAQAFGIDVKSIYEGLGYQMLEVPRLSIEERVKFNLERI
jgi:predicted ATPase